MSRGRALGLTLALVAVPSSCAPQLAQPVEQAIIVGRDDCFRFIRQQPALLFGDVDAENPTPCEQLLARLGTLLAADPNDVWARTERAEVTHVLAREHEAYLREQGGADDVEVEAYEASLAGWDLFLSDWNRTYSDLVYFRLVHQEQPELSGTLVLRQRLLLADFFVLNAQHAARLDEACSSNPACDRELVELLSGELFHLAAWTVGEALTMLPAAADPVAAYNLTLLREELCAGWILGYEGYLAFRNRTVLGTSYELTPCLMAAAEGATTLPAEVSLAWRVETLAGASYQALSRFYRGRRGNLVAAIEIDDDGNLIATEAQLRTLLEHDTGGISAQIAGDLLVACAAGRCERFTGQALLPNGLLASWKTLWRADLRDLRRLQDMQEEPSD